jgi:hypothetical protein
MSFLIKYNVHGSLAYHLMDYCLLLFLSLLKAGDCLGTLMIKTFEASFLPFFL